MQKAILSIIAAIVMCIMAACGGECLPDKKIGDYVTVKAQGVAAVDRKTYNTLMELSAKEDIKTITQMVMVGDARIIEEGLSGKVVEKDGDRAKIKLSDDRAEWWIPAGLLK